MTYTNDPFTTRDPDGPAHQFHRAGFGTNALQSASSELVTHLSEVFMARRETWTDAVIVHAFLDVALDGHHVTAPKATALMSNHTGAWGVDWNFASETLRDLVQEVTAKREETDAEWNIFVVRLSRPFANSDYATTQVRAFPVQDPMAFLNDDNEILPMLGGVYPHYTG